MGTSTSFGQLAAKMNKVASNLEEARLASFRQAERDMRPLFNRQARAAAGGDQRPHNARGRLSVDFKVSNGTSTSILFINPTGPWGLRDNTDVGGPTAAHTILPKKARFLAWTGDDGKRVVRKRVAHPGSTREVFWGQARTEAYDRIRRRIPEDVHDAIEAALNGSGFASRR